MKIFACTVIVCVVLANKIVICMSCGDGYFLNENRKCVPCPEHCLFCDSYTKCLSCESGYWGNVCEVLCSKCKTGTSCEKTNGFCLEACRDGLSGVLCDARCDTRCSSCNRKNILYCVKCASGRYPLVSCDNVCLTCNNSACDDQGRCTTGCVKGYWDKTCKKLCSEHCLNKKCDWNNGDCIYGCESNFVGPKCDQEEKTNTTIKIIIPVISAAVIVLVGIIILYCKRRFGNYRSDEPEAPEAKEMICKKETKSKKTDSNTIRKRGKKTGEKKTIFNKSERQEKLYELAKSISRKPDEDYQSEWEKIPQQCFDLSTECTDKENTGTVEALGIGPYEYNKVSVCGMSRKYYFNASYIAESKGAKPTYIACRGPSTEFRKCVDIFWRMVWQENCRTIVMLNTLTKKEEKQYWEDKDQSQMYGQIRIKRIVEQTYDDYIERRFEVQEDLDCRHVTQFQYTAWPEGKRASKIDKFLEFFRKVHTETKKQPGPIMVQGSAGVGRTGTFIALDMLTKDAEDILDGGDRSGKNRKNIRACVEYLRTQRVRMVETVDQYKFLHEAFAQVIFSMLEEVGYQKIDDTPV